MGIANILKPLLLAGIFIFGGLSPAQSDEIEITIHAANFPPYEIESPGIDGLRGFDVEVVIAAFKKVGMSAEVKFLPWNRVLLMAEKGTTVAALSCAKAKNRDFFFNYSDPISMSTNVYVARNDYQGEIPLSLIEGKGAKIVAVRGYFNEIDLKTQKIDYQHAMNDMAALNLLLNRNFDLFYSTEEFVKYVASELKLDGQLQYFVLNSFKKFHLCFSRLWPNSETLLKMFNQGLASIRADGTYDAIHDKYR